jgi:hypothetical protein
MFYSNEGQIPHQRDIITEIHKMEGGGVKNVPRTTDPEKVHLHGSFLIYGRFKPVKIMASGSPVVPQ